MNLSFCCFFGSRYRIMVHNVIIKDEGFLDLNPVQFGYENCNKSHSFGPAIRTFWLIHFVVSGFGIFKIKDKEYKIKPGEMFVIPPYIETYYEADSVSPWSYIWIGFTTTGNITENLSDVIKCPKAEKIFNSMKNCESFSNGRSAYLGARLWDLFALLSEGGNNKYGYVEKALEFIHSNYMHDITVEKIAHYLNLDRTYFSVIFKKKTGLSPKQYLLNYRMNIAATLIIEKRIAISVVANSVGYSDLYTFSKMFKRHFGISPSNYAVRE